MIIISELLTLISVEMLYCSSQTDTDQHHHRFLSNENSCWWCCCYWRCAPVLQYFSLFSLPGNTKDLAGHGPGYVSKQGMRDPGCIPSPPLHPLSAQEHDIPSSVLLNCNQGLYSTAPLHSSENINLHFNIREIFLEGKVR